MWPHPQKGSMHKTTLWPDLSLTWRRGARHALEHAQHSVHCGHAHAVDGHAGDTPVHGLWEAWQGYIDHSTPQLPDPGPQCLAAAPEQRSSHPRPVHSWSLARSNLRPS